MKEGKFSKEPWWEVSLSCWEPVTWKEDALFICFVFAVVMLIGFDGSMSLEGMCDSESSIHGMSVINTAYRPYHMIRKLFGIISWKESRPKMWAEINSFQSLYIEITQRVFTSSVFQNVPTLTIYQSKKSLCSLSHRSLKRIGNGA